MAHRHTRFAPTQQAVFTKLDEDEGVLLHLSTKRYYSLNETGVRIWELLEEQHTLPDIAAALTEAYEVGHQAALDRVTALVEDLRKEGLIEEHPAQE